MKKLVMLAFLVLVLSINVMAQTGNPQIPGDRLSSTEWARFKEIIVSVMQSSQSFTPDIHREFWGLINKMGHLTNAEIQKLKTLFTGMGSTYIRQFWKDALQAAKTGKPFKSVQREKIEKQYFELGLLPESRIKENEKLIEKIANHQPIKISGGTEGVADEEVITKVLENLDAVIVRVNRLFTRPGAASKTH